MADQDCDILGGPAGMAGAPTREFVTVSGALPVAAFPVGFFPARPQKSQGATSTGRPRPFARIWLVPRCILPS